MLDELIGQCEGLDDDAAVALLADALYDDPLNMLFEIWDAEQLAEEA